MARIVVARALRVNQRRTVWRRVGMRQHCQVVADKWKPNLWQPSHTLPAEADQGHADKRAELGQIETGQ